MAQQPVTGDDPSILDETALWRRIPDRPNAQLIFDHNLGRWRPTSIAFRDHPGGSPMSVTIDAGQDPNTVVAGYPNNFLASITAGLVRQHQQIIRRMPVDTDPNHAEVIGEKTKKTQSEFAKAATWVISPNRPAPAHG